MKNKIRETICICAFAFIALVCCSRPADAQFINKAIFARQFVNGEAQDVKMVFSPTDKTVYCVIEMSDPAPSATFNFVWTFYDPAQRKHVEIFSQELTNQSAKTVAGKLAMPKGLSEGAYDVEFLIDGRSRKRLRFRVVKE